MTEVKLQRTAARIECECGGYVVLMSEPAEWSHVSGRFIVTAWHPPAGLCACGATHVASLPTPETVEPVGESVFAGAYDDCDDVTQVFR